MPTIAIDTPSGTMTTELILPDSSRPLAFVILFFDAAGTRPSIASIGEHIAKLGYVVAIPDLFFRSGSPFDILGSHSRRDMQAFLGVLTNPEKRQVLFSKYYHPALAYDHLREVAAAVLNTFERRSDWNEQVFTTGYCMGGNASLRVATLLGARITGAASFHGGFLVTDNPDSPHLRVKDIRAKVYVAGATEDETFSDAAKATLIDALKTAQVDAEVETYAARHGFAVEDHPWYDPAARQRHDAALAAFFQRCLT